MVARCPTHPLVRLDDDARKLRKKNMEMVVLTLAITIVATAWVLYIKDNQIMEVRGISPEPYEVEDRNN